MSIRTPECPSFPLLIRAVKAVPVVEEETGSVLEEIGQEAQDEDSRRVQVAIDEGYPDPSGREGALESLRERLLYQPSTRWMRSQSAPLCRGWR